MGQVLFLMLGASLGALCRYVVFFHVGQWGWPLLATFLVNVLGSFAAGLVMSMTLDPTDAQSHFIRVFFMIGFLGSFTTFSAFSIDLLQLCRDMQYGTALLHMAFNVGGSWIAVGSGYYVGLSVIARVVPF